MARIDSVSVPVEESNSKMAPSIMAVPIVQPPTTHAIYRPEHKIAAKAKTVELVERVPDTPQTIDELIRLRATEQGNDNPIVAYPSKGNEYQYYTPRQVKESPHSIQPRTK